MLDPLSYWPDLSELVKLRTLPRSFELRFPPGDDSPALRSVKLLLSASSALLALGVAPCRRMIGIDFKVGSCLMASSCDKIIEK